MFVETALDMLGRRVGVGDLVVYGHSGRYAGTRVGRVYQVDNNRTVRVFIVEKERQYVDGKWVVGEWKKSHHSKPHGFVKIDDSDTGIPKLKEL